MFKLASYGPLPDFGSFGTDSGAEDADDIDVSALLVEDLGAPHLSK